MRCDPPKIAPPALPGSEDTPDVVPPLYADLDTLKVYTCLFCSTVLSSESPVTDVYTQKEEPLELVGHTYHVLEGPTSTQDTQVYIGSENRIHHTFSDMCVLYH